MSHKREPCADFQCDDSWRVFRIMAEFVEGFQVMSAVRRAVSIFGSARTSPDDPNYRDTVETARLLAQSGLSIITGGGPGIMEAANKGAFEAGGASIGLNIALPQEQKGNAFQTISLDFHYFYARKVMFTKYSSAFICFPGGFGTMDEMFEVLTLIQTLKIEPFPVLLYGKSFWQGLADWLRDQLRPAFIHPEDVDIFRIVESPREAVDMVLEGLKKPWWKPLDEDPHNHHTGKTPQTRPPNLAGANTRTGEGTCCGKQNKSAKKAHTMPPRKPRK